MSSKQNKHTRHVDRQPFWRHADEGPHKRANDLPLRATFNQNYIL
jgi:hypothetical protein